MRSSTDRKASTEGSIRKSPGRMLLISFTASCALCFLQFPTMASTKNRELSKTQLQTARLVSLGKLWANVGLFHPFLAHSNIDWDQAFVDAIAKLEKQQSDSQYAEVVNSMLAVLQDSLTNASLPGKSDKSDQTNNGAKQPFEELKSSEKLGRSEGSLCHFTEDCVAVFDLKDVSPADLWKLKTELAKELLHKKQKFTAIVFDMRNDHQQWMNTDDLFEGIAGHLCKERAIGPALRSRMYCGFAPEAKINGGHYYSGYSVHDAFTVQPGPPSIPVPIVILINSNTRMPMAVYALQSQPNVFILSAGPPEDHHLPVDKISYEMPGGIVASVRLGEWIFPDGHVGFVADKILDGDSTAAGDTVLKEAVLFAKSSPDKANAPGSYAVSGTATAFRKYDDMTYPTRPYRLLALFRIWSVFNYFFPYKDLMGEDWDQVLLDFVPRFEEAKDAKEYDLLVCEMLTHVHDSHVGAYGGVLGQHFGFAPPPVRCRIIEGREVITQICEQAFPGKSEIALGDIVKTVDSVDVATLLNERRKYISASTPQSLEGISAEAILDGGENTTVTLQLEGRDGKLKTVSLLRKSSYWKLSFWYLEDTSIVSDNDMFKLIGAGDLGYCDLRRLTPDRVGKMFEQFKSTKGIIFDMRGYPQVTQGAIAARLTSKEHVIAGIHSKPVVSRPFGTTTRNFRDEVKPQFETSEFLLTELPSPFQYTGKTVMLIDDRAVSQAEQTGLFLKAANGTKFIGSASAGANGTMTNFNVPGGLSISFTGEIICHPDGTQLQRLGLQPDVFVKPTIAGIRAGKDEVLEKAIEYLRATTVN
jgi:C-terminal processing protease CtpA/Prc